MGKLVAGANAALTAENPGLTRILVGLGWQVSRIASQKGFRVLRVTRKTG